jgi:hypothetical protein
MLASAINDKWFTGRWRLGRSSATHRIQNLSKVCKVVKVGIKLNCFGPAKRNLAIKRHRINTACSIRCMRCVPSYGKLEIISYRITAKGSGGKIQKQNLKLKVKKSLRFC